MPTPTIPDGKLFMNATLYTGNGSTNVITNGATGQSFQPDFVWTKMRSGASTHLLFDSIRGIYNYLISATTDAEASLNTTLTSFDSNGFSVGSNSTINNNTSTNVAWQWKAGGAAVSNTQGTITSSVSANTTSGFSIVTYTGTGSAATVGHGLGVAPSWIIVKRRNSGPSSWTVWHTNFSSIEYIYLNLTNAVSSSAGSTVWNSTLPSSSVISLGTYTDVNASGGTYVAYCWAPIAGYSAFGSYTGNGSTDGTFVYTGFRPKYLLTRRTDSAAGWIILDSARSPYNVAQNILETQSSSADTGSTYNVVDFLSNGFKFRIAGDPNTSGASNIYMAFAENPFKYANAR